MRGSERECAQKGYGRLGGADKGKGEEERRGSGNHSYYSMF